MTEIQGDYYIDDAKGNRVDLDDENSPYILNENDILVSLTGNVGRVSKMTRANAVLNQRVGRVKINDINKVEHDFLFNILKSAQFEESMKNASQGAAQANISNKDILSFVIKYPNLSEQQSIGSFFSTLDHLITLQQRELDYLKATKKTMLSKLFPKKSETIPGVRFDGFTNVWEQRKVRELFTITRGQVLAADKIVDTPSQIMKYPVYSSQTKNNGLMGYYSNYLFESAITWTTDGANAGTVNYREGKFFSTNVNGVLLSEEGLANYALAEIINKEAWKWVSHVGNPKLMNNVMADIEINVSLNFDELSLISKMISTLDHLITLQQRKVDLLKSQKQTLLKSMFPR
ncbi:restriction endonuclease subunit S [Streptococcus sp. NLN76]|uniref:restriction endonuclease subunit S n=1 Tax=Streptococcus sp. NLN76 TaxID=2822800 RepID=UPI0018A8F3E9|nr:restriction endonuclease subunit S [Streptococcus sp. NLN76]MBF8970639.1 restriction endonuclease subunit S [Streptococcus sp. NLN76]